MTFLYVQQPVKICTRLDAFRKESHAGNSPVFSRMRCRFVRGLVGLSTQRICTCVFVELKGGGSLRDPPAPIKLASLLVHGLSRLHLTVLPSGMQVAVERVCGWYICRARAPPKPPPLAKHVPIRAQSA